MQHPQQTLEAQQKARKKVELDQKINEQKVLQNELNSLRKNAKVYRQQQNSNILFLSGVEQEMSRAKQNMDSLIQEYQALESTQQESEEAGEEEGSSTPRETGGPG